MVEHIFKEKGWSFVSFILFDSVVCFYSVTGTSGWHICWHHVIVEAFMPHYPLVFSEDIGIKSIWTDNLGVLSNVIHHIHKHTKYNMQWNACVPTDRLWTWSRHLTSEKLPDVGIELVTPTPKVCSDTTTSRTVETCHALPVLLFVANHGLADQYTLTTLAQLYYRPPAPEL